MSKSSHYSVLLQESIDALDIKPSGFYVDGTFGRGGHSREILNRLGPEGRLLAFDKDPDAVNWAKKYIDDSRFSLHHGSFAELSNVVVAADKPAIDGLLLDLGVSSPQLDEADRGFSFLRDGPLDMRMDPSRGVSAADWINSEDHGPMAFVFKKYGEEKFSGKIASAIIREREKKRIMTTLELANIIENAVPKKDKNKHPATRVFQAIRIFINNELSDVESVLSQSVDLLNKGGRLVVISFHSLEDRIVKHFIREKSKGKPIPKGVPVLGDAELGPLKPESRAIKANESELGANVRSRSAVLRIASRR